MRAEQAERTSRLIGLSAAGLLLAVAAGGRAQPQVSAVQKGNDTPAQKAPVPADAGMISPGINACRGCHSGADTGQTAGYVKQYKSNEFVLLDEAATWDRKDVHSIAYANLSGPLGQKMEKLLGYKVAEAPRCLTCHSVDLHPRTPLREKTADGFATLETGVNCTACHGLGRNWQFDHFEEPIKKGVHPPWREKTPAAKFDRGMADLRSPTVKARLCASCHVGSAGEGRVVTHEMYAAGHPPLPPFELATFMECEPKHWAYATDPRLGYFKKFTTESPDKTWALYRYHPEVRESYLARHLAAGAVAALEAELRLIAADTGAVAAARESAAGVDYARFDCYACHHDLKYPSDRQKRGYEGPPGRPPLKAWVSALPEVVAKHAEGLEVAALKDRASEFGPLWQAVRKAAVARPFGQPAELSQAAAKLAAWCDHFLRGLNETSDPVYTPRQAERLLNMIAAAGGSDRWAADPEAAANLTWGYTALRADLKRPIAADKLDALKKMVPLQVRSPDHYTDKATNRPCAVEVYLADRLKLIAGHDAASFRRAFLGVAGMPK